MTVYAITDTKKGRTGIAPTYLQTTRRFVLKLYRHKASRGLFATAELLVNKYHR